MDRQENNLNLLYHRQRLMLKALNKFRTKKQAREALGISRPTLRRLELEWGVVKNESGRYIIKNKEKQIV